MIGNRNAGMQDKFADGVRYGYSLSRNAGIQGNVGYQVDLGGGRHWGLFLHSVHGRGFVCGHCRLLHIGGTIGGGCSGRIGKGLSRVGSRALGLSTAGLSKEAAESA